MRLAVGWRAALVATGLACAVVSGLWADSAAWPVVLLGRLLTVAGLALATPALVAALGGRLAGSNVSTVALAGARLRRPAGSLVRSLSALGVGLYVLSAGSTFVSAARQDPTALQKAYGSDGIAVLQTRHLDSASAAVLGGSDALAGSVDSVPPGVAGALTGSCGAYRAVVGARSLACPSETFYVVAFAGQTPPEGVGTRPLLAVVVPGLRAESLAGYLVTLTGATPVAPAPGDDVAFVPVPDAMAGQVIDQLVGADASVSVTLVGASAVEGAAQLDTILDVFRWGAGYAVVVSLIAALSSLVALLLDRRAGNAYLYVVGASTLRARWIMLTEVTLAAAMAIGLSLVASLAWAWSLPVEVSSPLSALDVASPHVTSLVIVAAVFALMLVVERRGATTGVPDRDGLVAADMHHG